NPSSSELLYILQFFNLQPTLDSPALKMSHFLEAIMRRLLFLGVLISFTLAGAALGDQVSLKNGDRISGTIAKSDGKTLVLHTDYAGDVNLKWDAVQTMQSSGVLDLALQKGKRAVGTVTS